MELDRLVTRLRDPLNAMTKTSCKKLMHEAALRIESLEAAVLTWQLNAAEFARLVPKKPK
jgi:hypothetical protein